MRTIKWAAVSSRGLVCGAPFDQRRNDVGVVISGPKGGRNISRPLGEVAPASFVTELAVESFPSLRLFFGIEKRELGALYDRDVSTPGDFQQPQSTLGFFLHPLVAAHRRDAQDVKPVRLQENQNGLHIGRGRPARILIDDDFDLLRLEGGGGKENQKSAQPDHEASWLHRESPSFVDLALQDLLEDRTDCSNATRPGRTSIVTPAGEPGRGFSDSILREAYVSPSRRLRIDDSRG